MMVIKNMSLSDLRLVLKWASREGWNPGLDDANAFFVADPSGFLVACKDNQPVAAISVVKQDEQFGFLGLYICKPEHRGQGVAWSVWQSGMSYLDGMTVGLDGVLEQQDNYRKSGFVLAYRNIRYAGAPVGLLVKSQTCRAVIADDLPGICNLDQQIHGINRQRFMSNWVTDTEHRLSMVSVQAGKITGFGTIRACEQGFKVGPLIAASAQDAGALLAALVDKAGATEIILDVPEPNAEAMQLASDMGLVNVFETARMYRGKAPAYDLKRLYGVTTFELG